MCPNMMQILTKVSEILLLEYFWSTRLPIVNISFSPMGKIWFRTTLFEDRGAGSMLMNIHVSAYWPHTLKNIIYS